MNSNLAERLEPRFVHATIQATATRAAITRDLPPRTWLGWKNFEDEDLPMLTPAQTIAQVHPTPDFISYQ